MLGVPLCLHSFFPWLAAETCPQPSANVHGFGGVLIRASCAGVDGLHMRKVQSRQLSHAFTLCAMGRTSSRTGFNFTDTNRFGKGRARDDYAHPLSLKPYSHLAPKDLILSWRIVAWVPGGVQVPIISYSSSTWACVCHSFLDFLVFPPTHLKHFPLLCFRCLLTSC